jgi:hypothetical protein
MAYLLEGFSRTVSSKELGEIRFRCCICQDNSNCQVMEWKTKNRFLFIPFLSRITEYSFLWSNCLHQLGFDTHENVHNYRDKLGEYGTLPIPSCADLIPVEFEERGILPKDRTARTVAILLTLLFLAMFLALACTLLGDLLGLVT